MRREGHIQTKVSRRNISPAATVEVKQLGRISAQIAFTEEG